MNQLAYLLWPLLGLLAFWAATGRRTDNRLFPNHTYLRLAVHLVLGPLMLVLLAWDYVRSGEATSARRVARSMGPKQRAVGPARTPAVATSTEAPAKAEPVRAQPGHASRRAKTRRRF